MAPMSAPLFCSCVRLDRGDECVPGCTSGGTDLMYFSGVKVRDGDARC